MKKVTFVVGVDFSEYACARYADMCKNRDSDAPYPSAEKIRDELLVLALRRGHEVEVDLTPMFGASASFTEELFVGLVREGLLLSELKQNLSIACRESSKVRERAWVYIQEAWDRTPIGKEQGGNL